MTAHEILSSAPSNVCVLAGPCSLAGMGVGEGLKVTVTEIVEHHAMSSMGNILRNLLFCPIGPSVQPPPPSNKADPFGPKVARRFMVAHSSELLTSTTARFLARLSRYRREAQLILIIFRAPRRAQWSHEVFRRYPYQDHSRRQ